MLHLLEKKIAEVCPIVGVNTSRQIHFQPGATPAERAAAQAIANAWDFAAEEQRERSRLAALAALENIDRQSVRGLREWVAKQSDAPAELKAIEASAELLRADVRGA